MSGPSIVARTDFGYFDVPAREYVITSPWTPAPWINYVGLEGNLCGMVSSTAGGPTWWRDPLQLRLTRYLQVGCAKDRPGRWIYLRDADSGEFWSPSFQPVTWRRPESYECRHGLGYTQIASAYDGIATEMRFFIPLGETIEIQRVAVRNDSDRPRKLSAFTYREFVNCTAANDIANIQYSGHLAQVAIDEDDPRFLYVLTLSQTGKKSPVFAVSERPAGFDTKCDVFLGDGSIENPAVVRGGQCTGSLAGDDTAVGVFQIDLELAPGEEKVFHVVLGISDDRAETKATIAEWLGDDARVLAAQAALKEHAVALVDRLQCEIPDPEMSVAVNTWNAYQCWINFQFSRSMSGYAAGVGRSMGTRDSLQDLLGYMHMSPDGARQRLLELMAAVQQQDGSCQHQYSALQKEGMGETGYSDDALWSIYAAAAYVKETGDASILDEEFAYTDAPDVVEDLYGHLLRAVQYSYNDRGQHGIPKLRFADWNDTIGNGKDDEVSESVLVGMMLVKAASDLAQMTGLVEQSDRKVTREIAGMTVRDFLEMVASEAAAAVNEQAWDEAGWYARGFDREGKPFGTPDRAEGKIFLEPQPWAVMAGVADRERGLQAMESVYEHLFTPYGIALTFPACNPAPSGGFHVYPKGAKENGGIFCHPNPWAVVAECILGRGDRAFEFYCSTLPPKASREDPTHYCAEPYVYGQLRYASEHIEFGKCAGTWLTGTAAWNYVAATQHILGIRPDWDGLAVDPCIPPAWAGFRAVRAFRGDTYEVEISNPDGVSKGVKSMTVDGEPVEGNVVPVIGDGGVHKVSVVMG